MPDTFIGHTLEGATLIGAIDSEPARPATLVRLVLQQVHVGGLLPAAIAASLLCPVALAAPGDLDPAFGEVGRASPNADQGPIWSVEAVGDDFLYAGGDYYCNYYTGCEDPGGFFGQLTGTGATDLAYTAAVLDKTFIYDIAKQADGKALGTGYVLQAGVRTMTVFRVQENGALDTSFGTGGIVYLNDPAGSSQTGRSVVIEADGRVVVSGDRGSNRIVVRLLANGTLDMNFGTAGVYVDPQVLSSGWYGGLVRVPDGGYRTIAQPSGTVGCRVLGLDAGGVPDATFGSAGFAPADSAAPATVECTDLAAQADGSLLVVGNRAGDAFVTRLVPSGARDTGFSGASVADLMNNVTAVAPGNNGAVVVAGPDPTGASGALVYRLQSDGSIDMLFGNDGAAVVEVESQFNPYVMSIFDMQVLADDGIVVAGRANYRKSFVAKLRGAGAGPGIASIKASDVLSARNSQAVVNVRRIGGSAGAVSVAYRTEPGTASAGFDYTTTSGHLSWGEGDTGDRQITVPILAGSASATQTEETFQVVLSDPEGGMGLGTYSAGVRLDVLGYPAGVFSVSAPSTAMREGLIVQLQINRLFYSTGAVSVTVTPVSGTATAGEDFVATPVVVNWADGDPSPKYISVTLNKDRKDEKTELFSVVLSGATGGALIASDVPPSVQITDDSGGGGRFGAFAALLLGMAGLGSRRRHGK